MDASQVIEKYEFLCALTGQMRAAAMHEEWDRLVSIERQCSNLVAAMKPLDAQVKLDAAERRRKNQLINKILADDAEIRNLTEARMSQLRGVMRSNLQEQRLLKTYQR